MSCVHTHTYKAIFYICVHHSSSEAVFLGVARTNQLVAPWGKDVAEEQHLLACCGGVIRVWSDSVYVKWTATRFW
ncbi:hypothetical protein H5410_051212, partial [Solanum commersonii]